MKIATFTLALLAGLSLVAPGCGDNTADPETSPLISTLQNDNFAGGVVSFQSGFVSGEATAVRLGPRTQAFTIRRVLFLFGGATGAQTVTLSIFQDGGTAIPGPVIYSGDYVLTPSDSVLQNLDLTARNIMVPASSTVRIAVYFQHSGLPSVANDGAITAGRNLIYTNPGGWITSESVSIPGDFVIRPEISTP